MIRSCLFIYVFVYVCEFPSSSLCLDWGAGELMMWIRLIGCRNKTDCIRHGILWSLVYIRITITIALERLIMPGIVFRASKTSFYPFELSSGFFHTINYLKVLRYRLKSSQSLLGPALRNSVLFHAIP